jgi:dTDP-4-dehydrorhamnose 3,5-epimerase
MNFSETPLAGAWVVDLQPLCDERGFFARSFCRREFEAHGLDAAVAQCNVSYNRARGTLRGMHYQAAPAVEPKLVRCTRGAIWDVIVDVRPDSPTYLRHFGVELSEENRRSLYVPGLLAHGFLTLTDDAEVTYQVGEFYTPGAERGIRYDDPALGIEWPAPVAVISDKDLAWLPFDPTAVAAAVAGGGR